MYFYCSKCPNIVERKIAAPKVECFECKVKRKKEADRNRRLKLSTAKQLTEKKDGL